MSLLTAKNMHFLIATFLHFITATDTVDKRIYRIGVQTVIIHTGDLAGQLLVDVLMADLLEVAA